MINEKKQKIVCLGLSGGVDSAVSCYLLLKQGYKVIPVFMKNWDSMVNNDTKGHNKAKLDGCESNQDYLDALAICKHFKLELRKVEFVKEYWDNVFTYFIDQYAKSLTPNPDILCNKFIKFGVFYKYVFENFECDYIATGHYAGVKTNEDGNFLLKALDDSKDQSYFLCDLTEKQLNNVIFPLGNMLKKEVRKIAADNKIPVWDKKDSTGICFIGKRDFSEFLSNYIPNKPGNLVDIQTKKVLGKHIGTMYYTIGQNKNTHLSGQKEKYYVCSKDVKKNIIYVCRQTVKDKYLVTTQCSINDFNFINKHSMSNLTNLKVRFRHLQKLIKVNDMIKNSDGSWKLTYDPVEAVTLWQYAVLYHGDVCVGGGAITQLIK